MERSLVSFLIIVVLGLSLFGCGDRIPSQTSSPSGASKIGTNGSVSEVSPPEVIQQLRPALDVYQPQVTIISPQTDAVFQDTTVSAQFQVRDLPVFKAAELGLGPHLQVILDNQPSQIVYDLNQPLVFKDLSPGTHTLRVFASRPWDESFKNEGAYAQTTFHIFTKTPDNNPNPALPILTYSSPTGSYGAEPIMLDFYLTNAPLHLVAQEKPDDEIADWQIRVTVNGQNFVLDKWQPVYLKGFKPGKNWVQLEFLDEKGNPVNNVFNNTARLITYEPKGKDTLAKLVRNEIKVEQALAIADPNYTGKPTPTPEPVITPKPTPAPSAPALVPPPTPTVEETPKTPEVEPSIPVPPVIPETKESEKLKPKGFFNRFRRPAIDKVAPSPSLPPADIEQPSPLPSPEVKIPQIETETAPKPEVSPTPQPEPTPPEAKKVEKLKPKGFFNRFRRPAVDEVTPSPSLPPPDIEQPLPSPSPEVEVPQIETPLPSASPEIKIPQPKAIPTPSPEVKPTPLKKTPEPEVLSTPSPSLPPTLPEIIATPSPKPAMPEVVLPQPTPNPNLRIIQPPADTDIPSSYLNKSAPSTPAPNLQEQPDEETPSSVPAEAQFHNLEPE